MKTRITIMYGFAAIWMILFIGCGDNNSSNPLGGCNGLSYAEAFQGEQYQDLADATTNFGEEQNVQTCEVYKNELQDWYNILAGLSSSCIAVPEEEYQESLAEAQQSIDEIDCSDFQGN